MGHRNVSILSGGQKLWNSLETKPALSIAPVDGTNFDYTLMTFTLKEFDEVRSIATGEAAAIQIVDARFVDGWKNNNIEGSLNLNYSSLFTQTGELKEKEELAALFTNSGVDLHKPIIFSCGRCIGACVLKAAAEQCGVDQKDWFLFDGSMSEYNDKTGVVVHH